MLLPEQEHNVRILLRDVAKEIGCLRSCINCMYFAENGGELCQFNNANVRPPARIIASGCAQWDYMPF